MSRPKLDLMNQFDLVAKPETGCWPWPFAKNGAGRAMFGQRSACNQLYERLIGPVPDGHGVLHACDNPACVRPSHWFTGDQLANVHDAIAKGRFKYPPGQMPGDRHALAKLTASQAADLKQKIISTREGNGGRMPHGAMAALARENGIGATQLARIANGERWGKVLS